MSVYTKLAKARKMLLNSNLQKSGKGYGFNYFELADFLPRTTEIFDELNLASFTTITTEYAKMTIVDGDGNSGRTPAYNVAKNTNYSTITGDKHTAQGIWYQRAFGDHVVFGCSIGCLVDSDSVAFAYKKKPILKDLYGCAIVYDSQHAKIVPFKDVR